VIEYAIAHINLKRIEARIKPLCTEKARERCLKTNSDGVGKNISELAVKTV